MDLQVTQFLIGLLLAVLFEVSYCTVSPKDRTHC
uniref:Uncharacterized protein n=1 Tax=Ciona savignyi TaxID=51511 RepID=H2YR44_CIOSA